MALMRITIIPIGTKETSISNYIADAIRLLKTEKAKYTVTDMGTIVEGDSKFLFSIADKMHETLFKKSINRIITTFEIDDRRDKDIHLGDKTESIKKKLD